MAEFDPSVPSIARVYDYFLGGKDHFASDRALADRMIGWLRWPRSSPVRTASSSSAP